MSSFLQNGACTKWGLAPFIGTIYSLGQKQRVLEPYILSLSSMVAATISQNLCPEHSNQLSPKWRCLHKESNVCIFFKLELKEMSHAET
jgi:hypothetical protein